MIEFLIAATCWLALGLKLAHDMNERFPNKD